MRYLFLFLFVLSCWTLLGQVYPNEFPIENNPDSSNFEVYSQKGWTTRRANLYDLKEYFTFDVILSPEVVSPDDAALMTIVKTTGDSIYIVDKDGDAALIYDPAQYQTISFTSGTITISGPTGNTIDISTIDTDTQQITKPGADTIFLERGGFVILDDDSPTNELDTLQGSFDPVSDSLYLWTLASPGDTLGFDLSDLSGVGIYVDTLYNVNATGVGVLDELSGTEGRFRGIVSSSDDINVSLDDFDNEIELLFIPDNVDLSEFSNDSAFISWSNIDPLLEDTEVPFWDEALGTFDGSPLKYDSGNFTVDTPSVNFTFDNSGELLLSPSSLRTEVDLDLDTNNIVDIDSIVFVGSNDYVLYSGPGDDFILTYGLLERLSILSSGNIQFNNAFSFPTSDGSSGQVLKTDGAGSLSWQNDASGSGGLDVEEDNVTAVTTPTAIDFGTGLDVLDDAGEADVSLDFTELNDPGAFPAGYDFAGNNAGAESIVDETAVREWIEDWLGNSFLIAGTDLSGTYNDGLGTYTFDYIGSGGGTDTSGYNLSLGLSGTVLELTDGNGTLTQDLASLQDGTGSDDQNIESLNFETNDGTLTVGIENGTGQQIDLDGRYVEYPDSLSVYVTPDQLSDSLQSLALSDTSGYNISIGLSGTTLELVDGNGLLSQDLASLQDGTGTDTSGYNLSLGLNGNVLELTDGDGLLSQDLSVFLDNTTLTEEQVEDFIGGMLSGSQNGIVVTYDDPNGELDFTVTGGGGSGETNVGQNLGSGEPVFAQKVDTTFQFKTLTEGSNISILASANELQITAEDTSGYNTSLVLSGTTLELTDGDGTLTQDLSSLQDGIGSDDQNIIGSSFNTGNGQLTIGIENGNNQSISLDGRYLQAEVDGSTTNELQDFDITNLNGTNLELSLTDDPTLHTVDLSPLQDGTGTDTSGYNLSLGLSGTTLELTDGDGTLSQDLASLQDGTGLTSFNWSSGLGSTTINDGETISVQGGANGIDVAGGGTNDLTINLDFNELTSLFTVDTDFAFAGIRTGIGQEAKINDEVVREWIEDWLGNTFLIAGTDLSGTYNDPAGTYTFDYTGSGSGSDTSGYNISLNLVGDNLELTDGDGTLTEDLSPIDNQTLEEVLIEGNNAGSNDIDMNNNSVNNMDGYTINSTGDDWLIFTNGSNLQWSQTGAGSRMTLRGATGTDLSRLGVGGISLPAWELDVNGVANADTIRVDGAYYLSTDPVVTSPGDTLIMVWADSTDVFFLDKSEFGGGGDNLGNHIATQTLDMDNNDITDVDVLDFYDLNGLQWNVTQNASDELVFDYDFGTSTITFGSAGKLEIGDATVSGYTFPAVDGSNGQVLQTDGNGTLSFASVGGGDNLGNHIATASLNMDGNEIDSISILNLFDTDGDNNFWALFEDGSGDLIIQDNDAATDLVTIEQDGTFKLGVTPATDATESNILVYDAGTDEVRIRDASTLGGGGSFGGIPIGADLGANATLEEGELIEFVGGSTIETDLSADSTQLVINQTARMLETATTNQLPTTLSGTYQTVWTGSIGAGEIDDNGDSYFNLYSYFLVTELGTSTEFLDARILVDGVAVYSQDFFHRATISDETFFVAELKISESRDDEDDIWVTTLVSGQRVVRKESLPAGTLSGAITIQVQVRLNDGSGNVSVEPENDHTWYERL
jgi:hypothetical protein